MNNVGGPRKSESPISGAVRNEEEKNLVLILKQPEVAKLQTPNDYAKYLSLTGSKAMAVLAKNAESIYLGSSAEKRKEIPKELLVLFFNKAENSPKGIFATIAAFGRECMHKLSILMSSSKRDAVASKLIGYVYGSLALTLFNNLRMGNGGVNPKTIEDAHVEVFKKLNSLD